MNSQLISISYRDNLCRINYRKSINEESPAFLTANSTTINKDERLFIVRDGRIMEEIFPRRFELAS